MPNDALVLFTLLFDEPRYCNNNVTTPKATSFTYQPGVRTNLEVTMLYAQVEVKILPIVTVCLARDPRGSKPNFYRVRSVGIMAQVWSYGTGVVLDGNSLW